jgi:hypothetical protein
MAQEQEDNILQQYSQARAYLEQTLQQEAEDKIVSNQRLLNVVKEKIEGYNKAVSHINNCLQSMQLYDHLLPVISNEDFQQILADSGTEGNS